MLGNLKILFSAILILLINSPIYSDTDTNQTNSFSISLEQHIIHAKKQKPLVLEIINDYEAFIQPILIKILSLNYEQLKWLEDNYIIDMDRSHEIIVEMFQSTNIDWKKTVEEFTPMYFRPGNEKESAAEMDSEEYLVKLLFFKLREYIYLQSALKHNLLNQLTYDLMSIHH